MFVIVLIELPVFLEIFNQHFENSYSKNKIKIWKKPKYNQNYDKHHESKKQKQKRKQIKTLN